MPKEKDFQLKVEKFLTDKGIYWVKYWGGGIYTRSGIPDLICCLKGLFLALELKTDDGIVSSLQEYNLEKISNSGGATIVLRPKYFEQFKEAIQKFIEEEEHVNNANNKITIEIS